MTTSRMRLVACACLASLTTACRSSTPPEALTAEVRDTPVRCGGCKITLDSIAIIKANDSVDILPNSRVAYLKDAHLFAVGPIGDQGRVALYRENGEFVRLMLRKGDGPSEVRSVNTLVPLSGDSLLVVSDAMKAVRISTSSTSGIDATLPTVTLNAMLYVGNGRVAMNALSATMPNIVLLDTAMNSVASFGVNLASIRMDSVAPDLDRLQLRLALSPDGTLWTSTQRYELQLRQWSLDGRLLWASERVGAWFPPYTLKDRPIGLLPSQARLLPTVSGLFVDSLRQLWLVGMVADSNWSQGDSVVPGKMMLTMTPGGRLVVPYRDWDKYLDGIVEVIDPKSHTIVARHRFPFALTQVFGSGVVGRSVTQPSGEIEFHVYRLRLISPGPMVQNGTGEIRQ
ncbi:MAG: hypothetical protein ABJC19_09055 [Gemmatimonadota bacterium]